MSSRIEARIENKPNLISSSAPERASGSNGRQRKPKHRKSLGNPRRSLGSRSASNNYGVRAVKRHELLTIRSAQEGSSAGELRVRTVPLNHSLEQQWLDENRNKYAGLWVALKGNHLLSSGVNGREVYEEAIQQGVKSPFLVQVEPPDELPFGGW